MIKRSKRPPQKWRKYELLEDFGLASTKHLRRTISRFPKEDREIVVRRIREQVEASSGKSNEQHLFVLKFVPAHLAMLLSNIRVQGVPDLDAMELAVKAEPTRSYDEIWFCRTNVSAKSFSVAGRLLVNAAGGFAAHTIEQVWRCSPRLIERLGPQFPYPYIRASRSGWGWSSRIEHLHIPDAAPESEARLREEFAQTLLKLDRERERLEAFVEAVLAVGLDVCCLEYKIEGDQLQIIDWDTGNDSMVVDRLLTNEGS